MTLVSYSTWSVLSSPFEGFEDPETGGDDVGGPLDSLHGSSCIGERFVSSVIKIREKRNRLQITRIAKMEIPKICNPESIIFPIKGRRIDFSVCFEEFMNVFPCS